MEPGNYWQEVWLQFKKRKLGVAALSVIVLFALIGLYAPLFASSKPLVVLYRDTLYFPLFRYLFYSGFYTKRLDLFYNLLMFVLPIALVGIVFLKGVARKWFLFAMLILQIGGFVYILTNPFKDPGHAAEFYRKKTAALRASHPENHEQLLNRFTPFVDWEFEKNHLPQYAKLNLLLRSRFWQKQNERLAPFAELYEWERGEKIPTLWETELANEKREVERLRETLSSLHDSYRQALVQFPSLTKPYRENPQKPLPASLSSGTRATLQKAEAGPEQGLLQARKTIQHYRDTQAKLHYLKEKRAWIETELPHITFMLPPLFRTFHWEEDAGGSQSLNAYIPWWELTRVNRKDLVSALLFGIRISLVVGLSAVVLSLLIGIPIGMIAGFFSGRTDMMVSRFIEIWEAMPTFFMLLLVIALAQSKSIFLVIGVLGIFGWTGFARFLRGEVLRQRNLPYVMACRNLGFRNPRIMFSHILPNAIPPILTLIPFSMMAAITSEAGLSFLGLGEEGSASWGVLMDEGRSVFPGESYLLWPPAILLTLLLIAIAIAGDTLRDALDPKLRH